VFAQFVAASCSRGDFGWVYVEADVFYLRPQLQPTAQGGKLSIYRACIYMASAGV